MISRSLFDYDSPLTDIGRLIAEEVVKALDDAWDHVKVHAYRYWL